ncbi:MAG: hypothetical protein HGJ94_14010 [Desulfosarcina sp.]|nr:hypothetical protein [Desulfosarcina sp.]MBC2741554.1 hypothetical protein [Desulfosarcina sp.]MBC2764468.1 hypothetical protein [Desulfosarcina sp.]
MSRRKEPAEMNVSFPKRQKVRPAGFDDLSVGDTVTCTVVGKVVRVEENAEEWSPGRHMKLEVKKFTVEAADDPMSMGDAVAASAYKA